jgi:hypothetical protein
MPEDSSNAQVPGGESGNKPGFVKKKIQKQKSEKNQGLLARARASRASASTNKEENLHNLLGPHLPAAIQAWIKGLKATKVAWNQSAHSFEDTGFPDHRVRSDCAQKIIEYLVGKAIERSMEISGNYKELSQVLTELEKSPEARRLLPAEIFESLHKASSVETASATVEGKTISRPEHNASSVKTHPHEEKDISDSEQKTPAKD